MTHGRGKCKYMYGRGAASLEWEADGRPQYYCMGYEDAQTDDLLPECKECPGHVNKAQDDLDYYHKTGIIRKD